MRIKKKLKVRQALRIELFLNENPLNQYRALKKIFIPIETLDLREVEEK